MTTTKASYATGATQDGQEMRRRNVQTQNTSNGNIAHSSEGYDEKKKQKVQSRHCLPFNLHDGQFDETG